MKKSCVRKGGLSSSRPPAGPVWLCSSLCRRLPASTVWLLRRDRMSFIRKSPSGIRILIKGALNGEEAAASSRSSEIPLRPNTLFAWNGRAIPNKDNMKSASPTRRRTPGRKEIDHAVSSNQAIPCFHLCFVVGGGCNCAGRMLRCAEDRKSERQSRQAGGRHRADFAHRRTAGRFRFGEPPRRRNRRREIEKGT